MMERSPPLETYLLRSKKGVPSPLPATSLRSEWKIQLGFRVEKGVVRMLWCRSQGSQRKLSPCNWPWFQVDLCVPWAPRIKEWNMGAVTHSMAGVVTLLPSGDVGFGYTVRGVKT